MNLIVGATGHLGGTIVRRLLEKGEKVRAMVRRGSDHGALEQAGAELVFADLTRPESLGAACRGAQRIIATATAAARGGDDTPETVDREGYGHLLATADAAGVEKFLFVSAYGFEADSPVALARAKAATEAALRAGRLDYTILRPVLFMEVWIGMIVGGQLQTGDLLTVIGDPDRPYGFVSADNVADLALAALGNPEAGNATLPLSAGTASYREIAGWVAAVRGRPVEIRAIEPGGEVPGLPPIVNELWSFAASSGGMAVDTPEVAEKFGLKLLSPRAFVDRAFAGEA